jgi:dCMP deaminase
LTDRLPIETYALGLAAVAASRSEDPFLQCGAAVLRPDGTVAALGYNGAPPKVTLDWTNRAERRKRVIHAEQNALRYTRPDESRMIACTHLPCLECVKLIRSYNIFLVYYTHNLPDHYNEEEILTIAEFDYGMTMVQRVG